MNANTHFFKFRNWPLNAFLTFSLLICLAGYALIRQLSEFNKIEVSNNLASIGQLKVNQIRSYLDERRGDAISLTNFLTVPAAHHWMMHSSGANLPPSLKQPLERVITANQYGGMLLLDGQANTRLGIGRYTELSPAGKAMAQGVLHDRIPMAFQIYFGDPSAPEKPLLDIFVPVISQGNAQVMGVLVLRDDLHLLYQLINTWPVQSNSAESLLVTRDGNDVLFLNELRHKKNTALKLRTPLNGNSISPGWPAVRAAQGYSGFLEAYDY